MEDITTGPVGQLLGDINIQDIIKAGLKICSQVRASGVLRTSAENALAIICQTIFSRLPGLDVCLETEPARQDSLSLAYSTMLQQGLSMASEAATCADREQSRLGPSPKPIHDNNTFSMPANHDAGSDREAKPYSLNAIEEIFRVLIDLLDLDNRPRTDQTMIALRLISTALEIAGSHIMKHAYLACLVQNELCHHLFQLIRSNGENVVLLTKALRVTNTLFMTCRLALKLQQEHHLTYLVACICSGADIPSEPGILGDIYEQMGQKHTPEMEQIL
jgi:brefeldin A-resistance guanine nucleotide exchange factor 1